MKLLEYTRLSLVNMSKKQTQTRYKLRTNYSKEWRVSRVDLSELKNSGKLVIYLQVGKYEVILTILEYGQLLKKYQKGKYANNEREVITRSLSHALRYYHMQVSCSCPDFKYRFAYLATKKGYGFRTKEFRPAKITNPRNKGRVCKHLLTVLMVPSLLVRALTPWVRTYIKFIDKGYYPFKYISS